MFHEKKLSNLQINFFTLGPLLSFGLKLEVTLFLVLLLRSVILPVPSLQLAGLASAEQILCLLRARGCILLVHLLKPNLGLHTGLWSSACQSCALRLSLVPLVFWVSCLDWNLTCGLKPTTELLCFGFQSLSGEGPWGSTSRP